MGDIQTLKVDKTKLRTFKNYAKMQGKPVQTIYRWANEGKLKIEVIDGVDFVKLP